MDGEDVGMVLIGVTVLLWSTIEVMTKLAHSALPPLTIAFLRFGLGGLILFPLVIIYRNKVNWRQVGPKDWVQLILLAFLGITCTFSLYHIALVWIDASSTATLISMVPLFTAPISYLLLREKLGAVAVTGLLVGAVGILVIFISEESGLNSLVAVVIMCIAVSCFSVYAVLMKPLNRKMDARFTTSLSLFLGGMMFIPILLLDGAPLLRPMDISTIIQVAYLSFIAVGLAYLFYFMGLTRVKVAKGNSILYLKPILATVLAVVVLKEMPNVLRWIGILLITISVYLVIRGERIQKRFLKSK